MDQALISLMGLVTKSNLGTYLRIDPFENHYFKCDQNSPKFFYIGIPFK